ncbi:MAG: hypothetical protein BMS9Abin01_1036 [Gammaproteobacteria bacterium]|nr:MAG: hypothetical protein BMS9Abin01_1036 [Gammaproteobacteria bacterium]
MKPITRLSIVLLASVLLGACSSVQRKDVEPTSISMADKELAESELLDVGIETFDAGTEGADSDEEQSVFPDIRNSEARYIPVHLKNTMQRTGYWGAVRVIPRRTAITDVLVTGKILRSDGETLELAIDARDATGRRWFSHVYEASTEAGEYKNFQRGEEDPFQDLYNTVANDLAKYKASLTSEDLKNIRQVAELRFAAWLAPDVFRPYLMEDEDGIWQVKRLPASDDPMLRRVLNIRERDYMLIDTLSSHYDLFYTNMWDPYVGWRKSRSEEMAALREVENKALTRKILGGALIAGAIALDILGGGNNTATLRNVMLIGGAMSVKSGIDLGGQAEIHEDAIRELGVSFEAEVKPLVVEVEGETVELTGSAETQYADWRRLLKSIYFTETGLGEVNVITEKPAVSQRGAPAEPEPASVN